MVGRVGPALNNPNPGVLGCYIDMYTNGNYWNTGYENCNYSCPIGYQGGDVYGTCVSTDTTKPDPLANLGAPEDYCAVGNPINQGMGNKLQDETDFLGTGQFPLDFERFYNSQPSYQSEMGPNWRHTYNIELRIGSASLVTLIRPNGKAWDYQYINGAWASAFNQNNHLEQTGSGWQLRTSDDEIESYDSNGRLISIADKNGLKKYLQYDGSFRLSKVSDLSGREISFGYDARNRITSVSFPDGNSYLYSYGSHNSSNYNRLISVIYPDGRSKTYHYNEPANTSGANLPNALTGITDENGVRYATYQYSADGRAISTGHAAGADLHNLTYNADGSTTVTDPLGTQRTHNFTTILGVVKSTGQSQPGGSGCSAASSAATYDANGNVASRADFNGNKSCYAYDLARNLETARVEGLASGSVCPTDISAYTPVANTAERKILTDWHATFRLPIKITEAGRETSTVYDTNGNVTSTTIKDTSIAKTRTWNTAYTYHATVPGVLVQKIDNGPRVDVSDLTTTDYYAPDEACPGAALLGCRGQLKQITNALGHVTTYNEYDAHGHVTKLTDANAVVTTLTYSPRGWLQSRAVDGKVTTYDYTPWGGLAKLTYPDATWISYSYDPAHRLTGIADSAGRRVDYTLDNAGNRTKETFVNADATPAREVNRVFDALGRLKDEIEGAVGAPPRTYGYYANGEAKFSTTPKGDTTNNTIDALGRAVQQTDPINGAAKPTLMQYDSLDQLIALTAPNGAATAFELDALGNLNRETSADRGVLNASYDEAGNRTTLQDARGLTTSYQYDALDRLTRIDAPAGGGLAASTTLLTWDSAPGCNYGIGQLCQTSHAGVVTTYDYDRRGNRIKTTRVEDGETFVTINAWNDAERPVDLVTPTAETIVPGLDAGGRVQTLASTGGGVTTPIAQAIQYAATGQIQRQTLGQTVIAQSYDAAGRLDTETAAVSAAPSDGDVPLPAWALWLLGAGLMGAIAHKRAATASLVLVVGLLLAASFQPVYAADLDLDYDANGNVISKATPGGTATFSYDLLDRIDLEAGPAGSRNHDFDAGGNRTSDGAGTTAGFTSSTDRLATINGVSVTLDAAGNLTSDGTYKYLWNSLGQLGELRKPDNTLVATYYYDHQNLRTRKVTTAASPQGISKTFYHYDQAGHLIAETTPGNTPQATYIWNGDVLTGFIVHQPARTVYTVQTDHLGSPFQVRTLAGQVVWRWESEAFGKTAPNEDVDGDGNKLTLNLRFPGQYFDLESGLHYNWNRYYSPKLGRYMSPDPIGLAGGMNLYGYVGGNPVNWVDPLGLASLVFNNGTLTVVGSDGNIIATRPAGNNTTNPRGDPNVVGSNGPAPRGTFPVQPPVNTTGRPEYGSAFFPVGAVGPNGQRLDIARQRGIGVHSGRRGYQSRTQGCIRVDESTIQELLQINQNDPITEITIQ